MHVLLRVLRVSELNNRDWHLLHSIFYLSINICLSEPSQTSCQTLSWLCPRLQQQSIFSNMLNTIECVLNPNLPCFQIILMLLFCISSWVNASCLEFLGSVIDVVYQFPVCQCGYYLCFIQDPIRPISIQLWQGKGLTHRESAASVQLVGPIAC